MKTWSMWRYEKLYFHASGFYWMSNLMYFFPGESTKSLGEDLERSQFEYQKWSIFSLLRSVFSFCIFIQYSLHIFFVVEQECPGYSNQNPKSLYFNCSILSTQMSAQPLQWLRSDTLPCYHANTHAGHMIWVTYCLTRKTLFLIQALMRESIVHGLNLALRTIST